MKAMKVKVLRKQTHLVDTSEYDAEKKKFFTVDSPPQGKVISVPDNTFFHRKIQEGYFEYAGKDQKDEIDPWEKVTIAQLEQLAEQKEVDLKDCKVKADYVAALKAAGCKDEDLKLVE